jgi:hypothetical protein
VRDPRAERAHGQLHVLAGLHVRGAAPPRRAEPVQQVRVHVVADAEGEQPGAAPRRLGQGRDPLRVPLAHRGQAVRHEEDDGEPVRRATAGEGLLEGARDVGAALGPEAVDPRRAAASSPGWCRTSRRRWWRRPVLNEMSRNRSSRPREPRSWCSAWRVCSIFSPAMEPETSTTAVTSRGVAAARTDAGRQREHEVAGLPGRPVRGQRQPHHGRAKGRKMLKLPCRSAAGRTRSSPSTSLDPECVRGRERLAVRPGVGDQCERQRDRRRAGRREGSASGRGSGMG